MTSDRKAGVWLLLVLLSVIVGAALFGCGGIAAPATVTTPGTFLGTPQPLGNGTVRSYVTIGSDGRPAAVGVLIDGSALSGLSDTQASIITLDLPFQASITPINHIAFLYEPTGHPPTTIYDVPQFDVNFFTVSQQFRQQIQTIGPANFTKLYKIAPADQVPPTYFLIPNSGVPLFGVRYGYFQDPALVTLGLTQSLDYWYYNGQMIGFDPFVALTFLKQQTTRVDKIQTPYHYPFTAYWPSEIASGYDPSTGAYSISVEGFVYR